MSRLVFFLEEYSMKVLLEEMIPRVFPGIGYLCVPHEGKQDLEKSVPRKLRAWREPGVRFVVVRDNDGSDCRALKARLVDLCRGVGRHHFATPTRSRNHRKCSKHSCLPSRKSKVRDCWGRNSSSRATHPRAFGSSSTGSADWQESWRPDTPTDMVGPGMSRHTQIEARRGWRGRPKRPPEDPSRRVNRTVRGSSPRRRR
jgi:hypothetical protein